jgi:hypothetical protein
MAVSSQLGKIPELVTFAPKTEMVATSAIANVTFTGSLFSAI